MLLGLYIEINITCIMILAVMLYRLTTGAYMKRFQHLLAIDTLLFMLFFVSDAIWAVIDLGIIVIPISISYFINILYFVLAGLAGYIWLIYCASLQGSKLVKNRTLLGIAILPFLILAVASINSPFTGWVFSIDAHNKYHRGSLYLIQVITTIGYIGSASLISLVNAFKKENIANKSLYLSLGLFPIFPVIAIIMQLILPGYPFTSVGLTLSLFLVFVKLIDAQCLADDLTLLYNRNWFYLNHQNMHNKYSYESSKADSKADYNKSLTNFYLLLLDIDALKSINNMYGISAGNEVLKSVAEVISIQPSKIDELRYYQPLRLGADEFLIICEAASEQIINNLTASIKADVNCIRISETDNRSINFTTAYIPYPLDTPYVQDVLVELDEKLYYSRKKGY